MHELRWPTNKYLEAFNIRNFVALLFHCKLHCLQHFDLGRNVDTSETQLTCACQLYLVTHLSVNEDDRAEKAPCSALSVNVKHSENL